MRWLCLARPEKPKIIVALPRRCHFSAVPTTEHELSILLSLEEFETVRLIDYFSLTQEECAARMGVGRGTVQSLYAEARKKIARFLIENQNLSITGGNFELKTSQGNEQATGLKGPEKGCTFMKIAVTYDQGQVFQHFGQTTQFKIFEVENGKITNSVIVDSNGAGHGALVGFLHGLGVTTLICGGIGGGARNAFAEIGLDVISGAMGPVDQQVASFLEGHLQTSEEPSCHHEGHAHSGHGEDGGHCHGGGCNHGH